VGTSESSGSLKVLSQLGITTQTDGTLAIDSSTLSSALETYSGNLSSFFTGEDGFLSTLYDSLETYTATDGLLDQQTDTINDSLSSLIEQQDALDTRISKLTDILYAKYNAMDSLVATLTATSESVMTTLNALNNSDD